MTTLIQGAKIGVKNAFCGALRGGANFAGLFPEGLGAGTISDALKGASYAVCDRNGGESGGGGAGGSWEPVLEPPFQGGQCDGVQYIVRYKVQYSDQLIDYESGTLVGAIQGVEGAFGEDGCFSVQITHAGGIEDTGNLRCGFGGEITEINMFKINGSGFVVPEAEGESCGNPPASEPEKINELEDAIDIEYDDIDGNPISLPDLPVKFFEPCINLDGVRIPFEIQLPWGKLCGKVGISGDIPNIVEPSIDIDLCPSQKEDLGLGEPEIEDYFEVSEPIGGAASSEYDGDLNLDYDPESLPIMGVFVNSNLTSDVMSQSALGLPNDSPNLIVPSIGFVIFEIMIKTGESSYQSGYSADIPIKLTQQFIPCPSEFGAVSVQVRWANNWGGNYRIAKRKSCCENCSKGSPEEIVDKLDRCRLD